VTISVVAAMAAGGVAVAGGACSSSELSPAENGRIVVDPGGTYGAEVTVRVVGAGRVSGAGGVVDCPRACFARVVSRTASAGAVRLVADAPRGVRFVGWTFATSALGTRGRGPEGCNPVTRAAAVLEPTAEPEIALPFGETTGTAKPGSDATCAAFTTVPEAYDVTATFEGSAPNADGGEDAGEGLAPLFASPLVGAEAGAVGVYGERVYWHVARSSEHAIASGVVGGGAALVGGTRSTSAVRLAHVGESFFVVQYENRRIAAVAASNGATAASSFLTGFTCAALASDTARVYCRTPDALVSWAPNGSGEQIVYNGLPPGSDLALDAARVYLTDESARPGATKIVAATRAADGDAGASVPPLSVLVSEVDSPSQLHATAARLFWVAGDELVGSRVQSAFIGGGAVTSYGTAAPRRLLLVPDPTSPSAACVGIVPAGGIGGASIARAAGGTLSPIASGLPDIGGVAATLEHVYWTQRDGAVYRQVRP